MATTIDQLLTVSDEIKTKYLEELNITNKDLDESVEIVLKWFQQQPHLPDVIPAKKKVENIFITCKGSIERTKTSLDMYYTLKTAVPELFEDRDPLHPEIRDACTGMRNAYSSVLTETGSRILYVQYLEPENFNLTNFLKRSFMMYELKVLYDHGNDIVTVVDMTGVKMAHIIQLTPTLTKITIKMFQEAVVARIKGIHFVNAPAYAHKMIELIKSFFSPKIRERIFSHKTMDDLHKIIGKKYLPKDFGGDLRTLKEIQEDWSRALVEHRDYFLEEDKHKTDESRRPGKPIIDELLGIHGSFRKLNVD